MLLRSDRLKTGFIIFVALAICCVMNYGVKVYAQPISFPSDKNVDQILEEALKHCESAEDLAACLEEYFDSPTEGVYETIPETPAGDTRAEIPSQLIGGFIGTLLEGTRIQISRQGSGESIFFGPFEVLDIPANKMEFHMARALEECTPEDGIIDDIEAFNDCMDAYFDRRKVTRYAERFSFIHWGDNIDDSIQDILLDDPLKKLHFPDCCLYFGVNNLHAVVPNTGFESGITRWRSSMQSIYQPALYLKFSFDSPSPSIVCTSSATFVLDCPDADIDDVSIVVTLPLIVDNDGDLTYDRDQVSVNFFSSHVDIHWDAGVIEAIVGRFVNLRQEIADEVENTVKREFRKQVFQDLISNQFMDALCRVYQIDEVVDVYITPQHTLVVDGNSNPGCGTTLAIPAYHKVIRNQKVIRKQ